MPRGIQGKNEVTRCCQFTEEKEKLNLPRLKIQSWHFEKRTRKKKRKEKERGREQRLVRRAIGMESDSPREGREKPSGSFDERKRERERDE